jgi:hypothetical protein
LKKPTQKFDRDGVFIPEGGIKMENTHQNDPQMIIIQGLLSGYLSKRSADPDAGHLDEDTFSAFVDGTISEREARPVVGHLVKCSFCRHITTDLIRLDTEMTPEDVITAQPSTAAPSRVSDVLSGILERMFGTGEPAVFAHSDEDDVEKDKKSEETEKADD